MENNTPGGSSNFKSYWMELQEQYEEQQRRYREEQQKREAMMEAQRQQEEARRQHAWLMEHSMEIFFQNQEKICLDPEGSIPSRRLYECYRCWCREQKILEERERTFALFVKKNAVRYNLVYSMNLPGPDGKHVRGYRGIREKREAQMPHASPASCG